MFNACGELSTLPNIEQNLSSSPLIGSILGKEISTITPLVNAGNSKEFMELMIKVADEYNLNEYQTKVLMASANSCLDISNPITLVHGVYFSILIIGFWSWEIIFDCGFNHLLSSGSVFWFFTREF